MYKKQNKQKVFVKLPEPRVQVSINPLESAVQDIDCKEDFNVLVPVEYPGGVVKLQSIGYLDVAYNKSMRDAALKIVLNSLYDRLAHDSDWKEDKLISYTEQYFKNAWFPLIKHFVLNSKQVRDGKYDLIIVYISEPWVHFLNMVYRHLFTLGVNKARKAINDAWSKGESRSPDLDQAIGRIADTMINIIRDLYTRSGAFEYETRYSFFKYLQMAN